MHYGHKYLFFIGAILLTSACSSSETHKNEAKQEDTSQTMHRSNNMSLGQNNHATPASSADLVSIATIHGNITLPANPHPLVVYDMTLMQDLVALGISAEGIPDKLLLNNLKPLVNASTKQVGSVFEPNLEALSEMQPQAILIGNRMSNKYEALSQVAPTLDLSVAFDDLHHSSNYQLTQLGKLFGKQAQARLLMKDIDDAINTTKAMTHNKGDALVISVKGNRISTFGVNSRFGYVHKHFGIPIADPNIGSAIHGQPISFEFILKVNPDWLILLDYNVATDSEGKHAYTMLDNALIHKTKAWQHQQIIYLSPDSGMAFGGYFHWLNDAKRLQKAFKKAPLIVETRPPQLPSHN